MVHLEKFYKDYPLKTLLLHTKKTFSYRYYKNCNARATVVLLTGGIGLSDLFYRHFEKFAKYFSVLTFDYQIEFQNNQEFAQAVCELLQFLNEKVWLVGQSLGGIVAQIIAVTNPQNIEGLILSNTCSLACDMGDEAYQHLLSMIKNQKKAKRMLSLIPFKWYKKMIKWAVMKKKTTSFTLEEKALMEELCDAMLLLLTKQYEYHMIDFLIDAQNHFGMTPDQFQQFHDRVLLFLSEDDHTFNQACKDSLIRIMPEPTVITNITGGHLSLLIRQDQYIQAVTDYILKRI